MHLYRTLHGDEIRWVVESDSRWRLLATDFSLSFLLALDDPYEGLNQFRSEPISAPKSQWLAPIEDQEVWACGVTYRKSRNARVLESRREASCYDRVYDAHRPQVFPKARGRNVIATGGNIGLRKDSAWTVPEPELVLIANHQGRLVAATAGNDVSCRDIEGENPLYQPQAKIWQGSCSLGPALYFPEDISRLSALTIRMRIERDSQPVFSGETNSSEIVRPLSMLVETLFRYRSFPDGAFLFTGTGIVPPDNICLMDSDRIFIEIPPIGILENQARNL